MLWRGSDLASMAELKGHSSRVLNMAQSPDGKTVVSQGADETLRSDHTHSLCTNATNPTEANSSGHVCQILGRLP